MDKKKEIEKMEKVVVAATEKVWEDGYDGYHAGHYREPTCEEITQKLIDAGYGDVEQVIKDLAKEIKSEFFFYKTSQSPEAIYQFTDSHFDRFIKTFLRRRKEDE